MAADRRGLRRGGAGDRRARRGRACSASAADGIQDRFKVDLRQGGPAVPALRGRRRLPDPGARPGRRQPADVLVRDVPALRRIGHKGADHIAPGNTPASFDAALAARRRHDRVRRAARGRATTRRRGALRLAHDYSHDLAGAPTLEEGLAHLAGDAFAAVELDVDLKLPGYEARVVEALRAHGLLERTLVSTQYMRSLVDAARARAGAAARLVGAARQARLHAARCSTPCPRTRCCSTRAAGCRRSRPATSRRAAATR